MMTVKQVSELTGVSIRTLRYYDSIGLLSPSVRTEAGYRLYDDTAMERLQQILLFRELGFPLADIVRILSSPDFDRQKALSQQIELLELRRQRLGEIIDLAREIKDKGAKAMDFKAFDNSKIEEYSKRARDEWGGTEAYREFEEKDRGRTAEERNTLAAGLMEIFAEFGAMKGGSPGSPEAQAQVRKLQSYITENMYNCTEQILAGLGRMYAAGGEFTENIDKAGGEDTAVFAADAIAVFCGGK